jgi:hypothetical protein
MRAILLLFLINISTAFAQLPGDFNCNGQVNGIDVTAFYSELSRILNPIDTASCFWHNGDINQDSLYCSMADYAQLRLSFSFPYPPEIVPQPGNLDTITVGNGRGDPGGEVYLPIYMRIVDTMYCYEINLRFNSPYLKAPSIVYAPGYNYYHIENDTTAFVLSSIRDTIPPGRYWIGNLRFDIHESAPNGETININLISGDYFPTGFANKSYPTYFVSPILIPGHIWVNTMEIDEAPLPEKLSLNIYPNPFNSQANIEYALEKESDIRIEILDLLGRVIDTPIDGRYAAGSYSAIWNASGRSSGVYFCRMTSISGVINKRIVLLK